MAKTLLAFGDSNTHGTPPITTRGVYRRFDEKTRWPMVMQQALGTDWGVIEEGLPGRTTAHACPIMGPHMNGQIGLRIALQSHGPIDVLALMLGTNDQNEHFGLSPEQIVAGIAGLLGIAKSDEYQIRHGGFDILLICPPAVSDTHALTLSPDFRGAGVKSQALPALLADLAEARDIPFVDAGALINVSEVDGVHFEPEAHQALGHAIATKVASL